MRGGERRYSKPDNLRSDALVHLLATRTLGRDLISAANSTIAMRTRPSPKDAHDDSTTRPSAATEVLMSEVRKTRRTDQNTHDNA